MLSVLVKVDLMDESILLATKSVILKQLSSEEDAAQERIRALEKTVETLSQKIDLLINKLG
jgi:hypothetical protein